MLCRTLRRLLVKKLADGTVLDGTFHLTHPNRLVQGVATFADGRCFKGTFDDVTGAPRAGSQLEDDGDLYVGSFNDRWQRHGSGEAWLADGTHYKGRFEDDELVEGTVRVPNGMSELLFQGTLRDEEFVEGSLTQPDFVYRGSFQGNKPHGKGKLVFTNGCEQEGTFRDGLLHGDACTMKLEGGFVYVGEFNNGKIMRGLLYTPTYTYDGEFNDQGKAHGEGTQTHLTTSPRLIFVGIWQHGVMVRGTVVDEYGSPVDWQDQHDLQRQVLGAEGFEDPDAQLANAKYLHTKIDDAAKVHKEMEAAYLDDAKTVQQQKGGPMLSKFDLGYEASLRETNETCHRGICEQQEALRQQENRSKSDGRRVRDINFTPQEDDPLPLSDKVNINVAKMKMLEQDGAQRLMTEKMEEQFQRFLAEEAQGADLKEKRGLHIDSNAAWKSHTPSKR